MAPFLTREESVNYVEDQLCVSNCKSLMQTGAMYELLCHIMKAVHERIPFHNFFLMAKAPSLRKRPNWETVKERMVTLAGGLCYTRNLFTFYLLRALGYEVKALIAAVGGKEKPNPDHIMIVASNVMKSGNQFLVDVGIGLPAFEPVDLNFEKETPPIIHSYLTSKYVKSGDNVVRYNKELQEDEFVFNEFLSCSMTPQEPEDIEHYFDMVYEDPKTTFFHSILYCSQYPGGKAKSIVNKVMKLENDEAQLIHYPIEAEKLEGRISEMFPTIPGNIVQAAVQNWRQ